MENMTTLNTVMLMVDFFSIWQVIKQTPHINSLWQKHVSVAYVLYIEFTFDLNWKRQIEKLNKLGRWQ